MIQTSKTARSISWYTPLDKKTLSLRQIALFGMLGALTFGCKVAMSALPNIEPVSVFVMVFAAVFGLKCLYPIYVYVLLEILLYGLGTWNIMYLYVWAILALTAYLMRRCQSVLSWAILGAAFGLCFGVLCAPVDFLLGDLGFVIAKWVSGIPFDLAHCAGNFVIVLLIFNPLRKLLEKLYRNM